MGYRGDAKHSASASKCQQVPACDVSFRFFSLPLQIVAACVQLHAAPGILLWCIPWAWIAITGYLPE